MKSKSPLLLFFATVLFFCSAAEWPNTSPTDIGRYQLVSGNTETISERTASTHPEMFRIDTATGRTWKFISDFQDRKFNEYWRDVDESPIVRTIRLVQFTNSFKNKP